MCSRFAVYLFRVKQALLSDFRVAILYGGKEAALVAFVAGGAILSDLNEERVGITIVGEILNLLRVPAALALHPVLLAAATPEVCLARLESALD